MNILVIGNGFDLEHDLPTQYTDFLEACDAAKTVGFNWSGDCPSPIPEAFEPKVKELAKKVAETMKQDYYSEFCNLITDNFWIDYFQIIIKSYGQIIGERWIDFEEEIKNVVIYISEKWMTDVESTSVKEYSLWYSAITNVINNNKDKWTKGKWFNSKVFLKELFKEHSKLIRAFELYIDNYVNNIDCQQKSVIQKNKYKYVVSFNYSNTYERVYDKKAKCCYVHGKADSEREAKKCDIVLGIEEVYEENGLIGKEVLPFEKYVQRIAKHTDNQFYEWFEEDGAIEECHVYFYGHSMAESDKQVLGDLIRNGYVDKTVIYCMDEVDKADKITNLTVILGREELLKRTSKDETSLEFEMIDE